MMAIGPNPPDEVPGLGPRRVAGFARCHTCTGSTFAVYGTTPLCTSCAYKIIRASELGFGPPEGGWQASAPEER